MPNFPKALTEWLLAAGLELGTFNESIKLTGDKLIELLLHMDGSDDGTTFIDSSQNAHAFTAFGGAVTKTGIKKFGTASGYFPSGSTSYIQSDSSNDIFYFQDDFTIEFWVNFISYNNFQCIGTSAADGNFRIGTGLEFGTSQGFRFLTGVGDDVTNALILTDNISALTGLSIATWYKIVIQRKGTGSNNLKIWVDLSGSLTLRGQATWNGTVGTPARQFAIGRYSLADF